MRGRNFKGGHTAPIENRSKEGQTLVGAEFGALNYYSSGFKKNSEPIQKNLNRFRAWGWFESFFPNQFKPVLNFI